MQSKRSIPIDYTLVEEFLDQECEAEPDYLLRGLTWVRKTVAKRLMPEGRKRSPYSRESIYNAVCQYYESKNLAPNIAAQINGHYLAQVMLSRITPETHKKAGLTMRGQKRGPLSPETKAKISAKIKDKWHKDPSFQANRRKFVIDKLEDKHDLHDLS